MRRCPTPAVLEALAAGGDASAAVRRHARRCPSCRRHVEQCRANNQFLAHAADDLAHAADADTHAGGAPTPPSVTIPGYRIMEEISRGGQGVVYRAMQERPARPVAIKVLLGGALATPRQLHRFEREIELAAQLRHPNIVSIYQSGLATDGGRYVAMEYVRGVALDRYVRETLGPAGSGSRGRTGVVLGLVGQIAQGVAHAHAAGVIHRDLKPSNILVDEQGRPRVLDFGLARSSADLQDAGVTQDFAGTPAYAAPERLNGDPGDARAQSDVYSLGMVLYQLLTDRMPYPCDGALRLVAQHAASTTPIPPRRHTPRLAADVETIVLRCLAKEPQRRYASAAALAEDIENYLQGYPITARRESAAYVIGKLLRRNPAATAAGGLVTVTTIAAAVGFALLAADLDRARRDAQEALSESNIQRARLMAAGGDSDRAEAILWAEAIRNGLTTDATLGTGGTPQQLRSAWALAEFYGALPRVMRARTGARCDAVGFGDDHAVWAYEASGGRWKWNLEGRPAAHAGVPGIDGPATAAYASADGRFALALHTGFALLRDTRPGGAVVRVPLEGRGPSCMLVDNGGRTLVSHHEPEPGWVTIRDTQGLHPTVRLGGGLRTFALIDHTGGPTVLTGSAGPDRRVTMHRPPDWRELASIRLGADAHADLELPAKCLALSPDGRTLAVSIDNTLLLFDAHRGLARVAHRETDTKEIDRLAFDPSGDNLCAIDRDGVLVRLALPTLEPVCRIDTGRRAAALAVAHRSGLVAVSHDPSDVAVYDARDRPWLERLESSDATHASIAAAADGTLAWGDDHGALFIRPPDGEATIEVRDAHAGVITSVAFSADGARVLTAGFDGRIVLWDRAGQPVRVVARGLPRLWSARLSPDDAWIAVGAADGAVRLWPNEPGAAARVIELDAARIPMVRFDPSGARLLCATVAEHQHAVMLHVATGRQIGRFDGHHDFIRAVAWSPAGDRIAVASDDRTIRIWDARTAEPLGMISGLPWGAYDLAFHPGGRVLFAIGPGGVVLVLDPRAGVELARLPVHERAVFSIALDPDGATLLTAGEDAWIGVSHLDRLQAYIRGNGAYWRSGEPPLIAASPAR